MQTLLRDAEAKAKRLRREHRAAIVADAAASDEQHTADMEGLRRELEERYDKHAALVKAQHEAQILHLEGQLKVLHARMQGVGGVGGHQGMGVMDGGERGYPSIAGNTAIYGNTLRSSWDGGDRGGGGGEREREELEKRIRQAEARSIALSQQLQSMPSSLQVGGDPLRVMH